GLTPAGRKIRFKCLVLPNALDERVALEIKRQLAARDIEMIVESVPQEEIVRRGGAGEYEAALIELVSGPTLLRPYIVWRSDSPFNWGRFGNATIDAALNRVKDAATEEQYRQAVAGLQQ